jgi:hypothetical protein
MIYLYTAINTWNNKEIHLFYKDDVVYLHIVSHISVSRDRYVLDDNYKDEYNTFTNINSFEYTLPNIPKIITFCDTDSLSIPNDIYMKYTSIFIDEIIFGEI